MESVPKLREDGPVPVACKVLTYATSDRGFLAFAEPDFPEVPLQVPGGTVELGEAVLAAARREFEEETGLPCPAEVLHLATTDYQFTRDGAATVHRRSFMHVRLPPGLPSTWDHIEAQPSGGGTPVLFRFLWLDPAEARNRLGLGMGEWVDRLPR